MKADNKVMQDLQKALSMELAAIHQYMLHSHVLEDWSISGLAAKMREEMNEEQGHADAFTRRIMFFKGEPVMKAAKTPVRAGTLEQLFQTDLSDEQEAIKFYATASRNAADVEDIGTCRLFESIVLDEEGHMAWLEAQLALIKLIGEPAYVAHHLGSAHPSAAGTAAQPPSD
jgi:bacterioferritin